MKYKYYALFSLFFIIAVYITAYMSMGGEEHSAFGISLPFAMWIVLILAVFFVCSSLFFAYSWVRSLIIRRNNYEDLDSLISQVLYQATQNEPKTLSLQDLQEVVLANDTTATQNERISSTHSTNAKNQNLKTTLPKLSQNPHQNKLQNQLLDTASLVANAINVTPNFVSKFIDRFSSKYAKPSPNTIKNPHLRTLSLIISRFDLVPNLDSSECGNSRIDKLFARFISIKNGKYEEIHKYRLSVDSPFVIKNWQNYALKSAKNALEVIKDPHKPTLARRFALKVICEGGVPKEIKKALEVQDYLDKPSLHNALQTCLMLESCPLDSSQIIALGDGVGFDSDDYLELAKATHSGLSPDKWLRVFSDLSDKSERLHKAFVFVLLELEMIDRATREIQSSRNSEDMRGVVAYMELKKASKENYPLKMFL
ncbi:hypothetical protein [Helicobacter sp. T3_23-1056]